MFVTLGLKNAWLNRGRTVLGIVSMAIAAIVFTSSSTLSQGYPAAAYFEARQLVGADIIMLPGKTRLSQEDLASSNLLWRFRKASLDEPNLTLGFDSARYNYGSLEGVIPEESRISLADMQSVVNRLKMTGEVKDARVKYALPFIMPLPPDEGMIYGFMEPRDPALDHEQWRMDDALGDGRYLREDDDPNAVAVVCSGWPAMRSVRPGQATLLVGKANRGEDGITYRNYEEPLPVTIEVVGFTRFREGGADSRVGQSYANPVLFVTDGFFDSVLRDSGLTQEDVAGGIAVTLHEITALEDVVAKLQREYPDFTVVSVPRLAMAGAEGAVPSGVPMDMRAVAEILAFLTAALLSAANLSVLMLARKTEIGILRSLGATRANIAIMVLTESVWIALMGAIMGNLLTRGSSHLLVQ